MALHTQPEEESTTGNPAFSRLSIARTVWKRRFWIISIWILATAGAVTVVRRLPAVYEAEAVILVDSQKIPEKFVSATVASDLEDRIAAIRQQILSSGELKKIISDFDLYREERKARFEEEILELMRKDISIDLVPVGVNRRPGAFRIGYRGADPALVTRVANRLTDLYVEQNLKTREGQAAGTSEFLETQLSDSKKRLDELEAAVSAYKLKHNGELPQQETTLAGTLTALNSRLEANRDAINRAQQNKVIQDGILNAMEANAAAQIRALESARAAAQRGVAVGAFAGEVAPRKTSEVLQEKLDLLLTVYTEEYPEVRSMREAIAVAKRLEERDQARKPAAKDAAASVTGALPSVSEPEPPELSRTRELIGGVRAQIKAADAELATRLAEQQRILREIDQYQNRMERLPLREQEMARLTRDYEISKENYKSLLEKRQAASMALDMERRQQSERFTVLDRARTPEKPIKPKRPILYGVGTAASLVLGLIVGFLLELRRNVFLGEWELPEGATVLARLPYIAVPEHGSAALPRSRGEGGGRKKKFAAASLGSLWLPGMLVLGLLSGPFRV
ncbi:MAG: hypothetical protein LAQ30_10860 [Acidobacteriia bacterium]|nr:hypothetical protein [Terriglobia bacterium]